MRCVGKMQRILTLKQVVSWHGYQWALKGIVSQESVSNADLQVLINKMALGIMQKRGLAFWRQARLKTMATPNRHYEFQKLQLFICLFLLNNFKSVKSQKSFLFKIFVLPPFWICGQVRPYHLPHRPPLPPQCHYTRVIYSSVHLEMSNCNPQHS